MHMCVHMDAADLIGMQCAEQMVLMLLLECVCQHEDAVHDMAV